jgi:hypothetical protein
MTVAQVSAVAGGTGTATPAPGSVGGAAGCTYKTASLNEVDTSISTIAMSPPCAAGGDAVLLHGVGTCALYGADIHLFVVFGST